MSLANQRHRTNTPLSMVNKTPGHVVFEDNSEVLWSCADLTVSLDSRGVAHFACLGGGKYLSPGERSVIRLTVRGCTDNTPGLQCWIR